MRHWFRWEPLRLLIIVPAIICCGPWANGIASTGVTATTNRTIAVDPTQIPYGSKVVINGQVYVAERTVVVRLNIIV